MSVDRAKTQTHRCSGHNENSEATAALRDRDGNSGQSAIDRLLYGLRPSGGG